MEDTTQTPPPVRRLVRARDGRWFGGVAAGLGRYFDVNPAIYRIVFAALVFAGGAGLFLYAAAWLVIPDEGEDASIVERALREHRDRPGLAVGVGLIAFAGLIVLSHAAFWPDPGALWFAAVLVGAALVWWELRTPRAAAAAPAGGSPAPAAAAAPPGRRRPSLFLPVVGALLAAAGVFGALAAVDVPTVDLRIVLAGAVVLVGAAVAFGAATARRVTGLVGLGLILLVALVLTLAIDVPVHGRVGDRDVRPATAAALADEYRQGAGRLTLHLGDLRLDSPRTVDVSLGAGKIVVYVPDGAPVVVDGHAGVGHLDLLGRESGGFDVDDRVREPGDGPALTVHARVGTGDVEVRRR